MDKINYWHKVRLHIPEAVDTINAIKVSDIKFSQLRAPITGPFTLASRIYLSDDIGKGLSSTCISRKELVLDIISRFVVNVVKYVSELGYNIVFLDEPVFNYIIGSKKILFDYKEEEIIDTIDRITSSVQNIEYGIHVCGRLNIRIIGLLTQIPRIRYINIELYDSPSNLNLISKEVLEKNDKYLAPGIVSSQKLMIESVDEATNLLINAYGKSGGRIDLISADCGFRGLRGALGDREKEYDIAIAKLRTVVESVRRVEAMFRITM